VPRHLSQIDPSLWYGFGLFAFLLVCGVLARWVRRPWGVLCIWLQKVPVPPVRPVQAAEIAAPSEPSRPNGSDQGNSQVSAEELL
jgi:hypothetical protein